MMLEKLIVFVEEYSMEVALEILLPKMLGSIEYQIITFSCKNELLKQLPERLKGYSTWLPKSWSLLVLVDQDDDDCHNLKQKLEEYAQSAGFITKTAAPINTRIINLFKSLFPIALSIINLARYGFIRTNKTLTPLKISIDTSFFQ